jgi:hypothetical protein
MTSDELTGVLNSGVIGNLKNELASSKRNTRE